MTNHNLMIRLAAIRRQRGLTERDVADHMGVSRKKIGRVRLAETGATDPQLSTVLRYAYAVGARLVVVDQIPPATPYDLLQQIAAIRVQRGLTRQDVADRMGGGASKRVTWHYVYMIETGRSYPRLRSLVSYADAVGARIVIQVDPPADGGAR